MAKNISASYAPIHLHSDNEICWIKPQVDYLKIDCDGAFKSEYEEAGTGLV